MDGIQLRDEAVRDRVRAAQEFLDPSMVFSQVELEFANRSKAIPRYEATDRTSF